MDRSEAYGLLTEEMKKLSLLQPDQLIPLCEREVGVECCGASETLYRVVLNVEQKSNERFVIFGSIHDNSSFRFSLLEERQELDFTEKS